MKPRGGYTVMPAGRPAGVVEVLPEVPTLSLPLKSRRFSFTDVMVKDGERVRPGQMLAKDPKNYGVPLLAPRAGTVRLTALEGHVVLERIESEPEEPFHPAEAEPHIPRGLGSVGIKRYKLLALGAWRFFEDAHTGALPDPFGTPQAVIVSTVDFEPFVARGDVQLMKRLDAFCRGLEHIQGLLEYQPIHLVLPETESQLAERVREHVRGYAWIQTVVVPMRYGLERFPVLARGLGLKAQGGQSVWATGVGGVLAIDRALTLSRPATVRLIALGGPGIERPTHLKAIAGYPLDAILEGRTNPALSQTPLRVIDGGVFIGRTLAEETRGLDAECTGLTVLAEATKREFLGFMRPGFDRRSYSRCFLSAARPAWPERLTTALRGERRPCIACGFCEEVCPARIMPHLIHKSLYGGSVETAERLRVDLCVRCGLCSFVCPSKIELRREFVEAQATIAAETVSAEGRR